MDELTSFKAAFLAAAVGEGWTPEETKEAALALCEELATPSQVKAAFAKTFDKLQEAGSDAAINTAKLVGLTAAFAPPVIGAGLGWLGAKATDVDDTDVEQRRQQEIVAEYKRLTEQARRNVDAKRYALNRKVTGRVFV